MKKAVPSSNAGARHAVPVLPGFPYHGGICWWWQGASGKVKIGVLEAYQGAWMVGWVNEKTGGRHKLNSSALSKHQLSKDPDALLAIVLEWAAKRDLRKVDW